MKKLVYTVSYYLLDRLKELGVDHIFGVPGDFVLGFFHAIEKRQVKCICTCNELNAAYAADGYARIRGLGAVSTTYVVGELSAINGVAGAYAERVPVVKITGWPASINFKSKALLHHTLGDYMIPLEMYRKITIASKLLLDPHTAPFEIDQILLQCLYHQLPVYLALPSDIAMEPCEKPKGKLKVPARPLSEPNALSEALKEALELLSKAKKPIVLVDGEIGRFRMEKEVKAFIESTGLPFAALLLGKSLIDEHHPQFIGLYEGSRSRKYVRERVENADAIIHLGPMLTDFNTGGFTAVIEEGKTISASIDRLKIRHHFYEKIHFAQFLKTLGAKLPKRNPKTLDIHAAVDGCPHRATLDYQVEKKKKLTLNRFYDRISHFLTADSIMIVETGSSLFAGAEVLQPKGGKFMSQTFFGSIGYSVGATLGVAIAEKKKRACLFIGDGSFQVTCQDVSTMIRYHTNPIIFLINNDGYLIERVILDGPFNDIQPWNYHLLPQMFGGGWGCKVKNEEELEEALKQAQKRFKEVVFIEIVLDKWDSPPAMTEAGKAMARSNFLQIKEKASKSHVAS